VSGPAGSGKTTTAYACLREIVKQSHGGKSVLSLEDPIEVAVDGVAQSQVNDAVGFSLAIGLRSLLRQDPQVILVGEIRDRVVAEQVFQAAITGHLMLTTFHAGSSAEAISRLTEMQIEPYVLRSGLLAIVNQRLVRRLCQCAAPITDPVDKLGLPVDKACVAVGCESCWQTGYRGRSVLAEILIVSHTETGRAILSREDAATLQSLAIRAGMRPLWQRACTAVEQGITSPAELRRVFGFRPVGSR
jgi:type II secretory ATPase GspE/PulE/Tfp pilus assembly ATPase PilB-like protein